MKGVIIFGTMGSGKDTVAQMIKELLNATEYKLGYYIRQNVDEFQRLHATGVPNREAYQNYGQGMRHLFGDDFWCELTYNRMIQDDIHNEFVVISDGRQPNELRYWDKRGLFKIGVHADVSIRRQRLELRDGQDQLKQFRHETELSAIKCIDSLPNASLTNSSYIIDNNGSKRHLKDQVYEVVEMIKQYYKE